MVFIVHPTNWTRVHKARWVQVFVVHPTNWTRVHKARWVQVQDHIPDMPGINKNAFGPVGFPLKKGTSSTRW